MKKTSIYFSNNHTDVGIIYYMIESIYLKHKKYIHMFSSNSDEDYVIGFSINNSQLENLSEKHWNVILRDFQKFVNEYNSINPKSYLQLSRYKKNAK